MNTIGDFVSPNGPPSDKFGTIPFAKKDVTVLQLIFRHTFVWHINHFYLTKIEP